MLRAFSCILLLLTWSQLIGANPVLMPDAVSVNAIEQQTVTLFATVAISDSDNINMLTVTVTAPVDGDVLSYGNLPGGINVQQGQTPTSVVFAGNAIRSHYDTVLQELKFNPGSDQPGTTRIVNATVRDVNNNVSLPVKATVTIAAVNDAPIFSPKTFPTVAEQATIALYPNSTISDPDSATLIRLEVVIANPVTGDILAYDPPAATTGITISPTSTPTSLIANGPASPLAFRSLLNSITFTPNSDTPGTSRTITATVKDKDDVDGKSAVLESSVTITQANDAPVIGLTTSQVNVFEQQSVNLFPLAEITDPDSVNLSRLVVTIGSALTGDTFEYTAPSVISVEVNGGTLTATGNVGISTYRDLLRSIKYRPNLDAPGITRSVTVTVRDSTNVSSNIGSVTVGITEVNDPPELGSATTPTVQEQAVVVLYPSATVNDPDSTNASRLDVVITNPQAGDTLALAAGFTVPTGIQVVISANSFSIEATGPASRGSYAALLGAITYKAETDTPVSPRSVTATLRDDANPPGAAQQIATVTITAVNDPPVIAPPATAPRVTERGPAVATFPAAFLSDVDGTTFIRMDVMIDNEQSTDLLGWVDVPGLSVAPQTNGDLVVTPTAPATTAAIGLYQTLLRSVTFQPNGLNPGSQRVVRATVRDKVIDGATSAAAIATITIDQVNDPPTIPITALVVNGVEDQALTLTFAQLANGANDPDETTPTLKITSVVAGTLTTRVGLVDTPVGPGTVLSAGEVVWTPPANAVDESIDGVLAFTVSAWDGANVSSTARPIRVRLIHRVDIAGLPTNLTYNLDSGRLRLFPTGTNNMVIDDADRLVVVINQSTLTATVSGGSADQDVIGLSGVSSLGLSLADGFRINRGTTNIARYSKGVQSVTITFTADAIVEDIEQVSRCLVYDNIFGDSGSLTPRVVRLVFHEHDRTDSNTLTCTIRMSLPNLEPIIVLGINENKFKVQPNSSAVIAKVNLEAVDPERALSPSALVFRLLSAPAYGTLRVNRAGSFEALVSNATFTQAEIDGGVVSYLHRGGTIPTDSMTLEVREEQTDGLTSDPVTFLINIGVPRGAGIISDPLFVANAGMQFTHTITLVGLTGVGDPLVTVVDANNAIFGTVTGSGSTFVWTATCQVPAAPAKPEVDVTVRVKLSDTETIIQPMRIHVVGNLTPSGGG